jgi:hypothetical protein
VKLGKTERVLGFECQWIQLQPRDDMRFAQRLCSELSTGLIVRAKVLNLQKQVIEQYTFTDLRIGPQATRAELKSLFRAAAASGSATASRATRPPAPTPDGRWPAPAGFQKVAEFKRTLPGAPSRSRRSCSPTAWRACRFRGAGRAGARRRSLGEDGTTPSSHAHGRAAGHRAGRGSARHRAAGCTKRHTPTLKIRDNRGDDAPSPAIQPDT